MKSICLRCFLTTIVLAGLMGSVFASTNQVQYHTNVQLQRAFENLQRHYPELVHVSTLAKTRHGKPILLIRVGHGSVQALDGRSGILIVGSVEGDHLVGSEVALGIVKKLSDSYEQADSIRALLNNTVLYVIPRLNPEGASYFFKAVRWDHPWNNTPTDEDHDGRTDEDGPEDLNGDHLITWMRVKSAEGTAIPDKKNPELLREADPARGEVGIYKLYLEGKDDDQDGSYNEDGIGGVNINWNFPQFYQAFRTGAGAYTESEPETRAISKFVFDHRNIVLALVYSLHDNLVHPPKAPRTNQNRSTEGRAPGRRNHFRGPAKEVQKEDIVWFQTVGSFYKTIMQVTEKAEPVTADDQGKGSLGKWLYFQAGIPAFVTSLMTVPEGNHPQRAPKDSGHFSKSRFLPQSRTKEARAGKKDVLSTDRKWLAYFKSTGQPGFIAWKPFKHPQLGLVEIGGFAPFARTMAPATEIPKLIQRQFPFWTYLLKNLPKIKLEKFEVEKRGDRVYKISVRVCNEGRFPTATAFGARTRLIRPILLKIFPEKGHLLTGNKIVFLPRLLGGEARKVDWLLTASKGSQVTIKIISQNAGTLVKSVVLK